MEYKPLNLAALLVHIKHAPIEEAAELIKAYGDVRETRGIESGWRKCTQLHRKCLHLKRRSLEKFTMEEQDGYVELHDLNKLMFFITDALEKKGLSDLADDITVKLGNVRIDRRLTFISND